MIHRTHRFYGGHHNSFEITWNVTSFTVSTEVSSVRIAMTLETTMTSHWKGPIQLRDCNLLPVGNAQRPSLRSPRLMAQGASRVRVWSVPRKFRHAIVVELRGSLFGTVALGTVLPELAAVFVVLLVAVETAVLAELVLVLIVTCLAREGLVFALEFERLVLEAFGARRVEPRQW